MQRWSWIHTICIFQVYLTVCFALLMLCFTEESRKRLKRSTWEEKNGMQTKKFDKPLIGLLFARAIRVRTNRTVAADSLTYTDRFYIWVTFTIIICQQDKSQSKYSYPCAKLQYCALNNCKLRKTEFSGTSRLPLGGALYITSSVFESTNKIHEYAAQMAWYFLTCMH